MSNQITNENKEGDCSPPGAGRTFLTRREIAENPWYIAFFPGLLADYRRRIETERDANTTLRHGDWTGIAVLVCSLALSSAFWPDHPFSCHPTDIRTTNHTPACEARR